MVKHNNVIPNGHFHKDWQERVKTWFNQPARKLRRRQARIAKAKAIFPRPVDGKLRPVVHAQTARYNLKVRLGRGFTLEELKEAKVSVAKARSIGIAVDYRRSNKSSESLQANVQRLKEYLARVVILDGKTEATPTQVKGTVLPIVKESPRVRAVAISEADKKASAYFLLKFHRAAAKYQGRRAIRAKAKAKKAEGK